MNFTYPKGRDLAFPRFCPIILSWVYYNIRIPFSPSRTSLQTLSTAALIFLSRNQTVKKMFFRNNVSLSAGPDSVTFVFYSLSLLITRYNWNALISTLPVIHPRSMNKMIYSLLFFHFTQKDLLFHVKVLIGK